MAEIRRSYNILRNLKKNLEQFGADEDSPMMREYKQLATRMKDVLGIKRKSGLQNNLPTSMTITEAVGNEETGNNERLHAEPT